jgi:tetratricopeptide (TPR) repeat protein
LGDYESALKSCDIAIKINPKDVEASNFKSFILKEKTDFEKAIEYSDNTFRVKPSYQINNFDYFLKLPYLSQVSTINVSNNQIDDNAAKVLANSLSKGQMPNLKKLQLEGNKITKEGMNYFPFALEKMNQDIKVSLLSTKESLYTSYKLSALGDKNIKKEMLVDILQKAADIGLDVDNISIDRTTWGFIKNKVKVSRDFVFGVAKCLIPKNGKELLTDMIVEKTPKIIKTPVSYLELADCASEGIYYSRLTEAGVALTKHELELLGNNSEGSVYENIFIEYIGLDRYFNYENFF